MGDDGGGIEECESLGLGVEEAGKSAVAGAAPGGNRGACAVAKATNGSGLTVHLFPIKSNSPVSRYYQKRNFNCRGRKKN